MKLKVQKWSILLSKNNGQFWIYLFKVGEKKKSIVSTMGWMVVELK